MGQDLFQKYNIAPPSNEGEDLFAKYGMTQPAASPSDWTPAGLAQMPSYAASLGRSALQGLTNMGGNIIGDVGTGLSAAGAPNLGARLQSIGNQAANVTPQQMGISNPDIGNTIIKNAAQYLPYALGEGEFFASKALADMSSSSVAKALLSPGMQRTAQAGALYGLTQSSPGNAIRGGLQSALLNSGLHVSMPAIANSIINAPSMLKNFFLSNTENEAKTGGALTPQETAENISTNYTDANGQQLPVDMGTATNNPSLKNTYQALQYIPFTGARENANLVQSGILNKNISNAQKDISTLASGAPSEQGLLQKTQPLQDQLSSLSSEKNTISPEIQNSPNFVNSLVSGIEDPANLNSTLKGNVKDLFKQKMDQSSKNYAPINEAENLSLNKFNRTDPFPNYNAAATPLLNQKQQLLNIFGSDSDMGNLLNGELNKASQSLSNPTNSKITLGDARDRIQSLGKLSSAAYANGSRNEARLLTNLKASLQSDTDAALRYQGQNQLADQLKSANAYHEQNVIPFYANNEIRLNATDKNYVSKGDSLAKALHDPNYKGITQALPQSAQNGALFQLITKGKGTSSGLSNLSPKQIANNYQSLPRDYKTLISQYNPQADQLFENLPNMMARNNDINTSQKTLQDQLNYMKNDFSNQQDIYNKNMQKNQDNLNSLKQQKFGSANLGTPGSDIVNKALKAGGISAALLAAKMLPISLAGSATIPIVGKILSKALTDPKLLKAYVSGEKFPVKNANVSLATKLIQSASNPSLDNSGAN